MPVVKNFVVSIPAVRYDPPMPSELSPFTRWALDDARTADERFLAFQICEACRLIEWHQIPLQEKQGRIYRHVEPHVWKSFYLNPLLMPEFGEVDTERAARLAPHFKKFAPVGFGNEMRRIGNAGDAFRFFPALEDIHLGSTSMSDLSFLEALPHLRHLQMQSGVLEDFGPFRHASRLRRLSIILSGSGAPLFTPPLYWVDASPLAALRELEQLTWHPNPAALEGLEFPSLHTAELDHSMCVQRDCSRLPEMPRLRVLKLGGVQSLRGISRFPELRHLKLTGPLRDFAEIESLQQLDCLEVDTHDGWPRDVSPLTRLGELLWVRFSGVIPRNYWPLAQAPKLCQLEASQSPAVMLDVQAVNAVLRSWDEEFAVPPRSLPPMKFIAVEVGGDFSLIPRGADQPGEDYLAHPKKFHLELLWMLNRALKALEELLGDADAVRNTFGGASETNWTRSLSFSIESIDVLKRYPEIIDTLRGVMAVSPHPWLFQISIFLRIKESEMDEERKKWLRQMKEERDRWDEDEMYDVYKKTQEHLIETQFRKRVTEEEGEEADPEDFEPPEEIRGKPWRGITQPAGGGEDKEDDEEEERPDFQLKPFDEQEQNDPDDPDDGEGEVKTAPPPDPPPSFFDDPREHPLADSYRFFATLSFDAIYHHGGNLATHMQLLKRDPDVIHPAKKP